MSVLIKGMEMPGGCIKCPFLRWVDYDCMAATELKENGFCNARSKLNIKRTSDYIDTRHPKCPLVEVPTVIEGDARMSVLIKGMEMPQGNAERCVVIKGDGTVTTMTGAIIAYMQAVEVPTPKYHRMSDLISRQDAIDAIKERDPGCWEDACYIIENLPSAEPKIIGCKDCKYYLNSKEKCELIDTRLHFYETNKTWDKGCFCSWAERRSHER